MNQTSTPIAAEVNVVAQKHARVIELMAHLITAQAGITEIVDRADKAATVELLKCDESLQGYIAQSTAAEAELEALTRELIKDDSEKRSITTPFGALKLVKATALVSPENGGDESVIKLIKLWEDGELGPRATKALEEVETNMPAMDFLRTTHELNREALEGLTDAQLGALGLIRVKTSNFTISRKKITAANAQALLATAKEKVAAS